jgi:GTP-binding protein
VGQAGRQQFDAFTRSYFTGRPNLAMVFLLVDASVPPQRLDLDYANWLTDNEVPFTLVRRRAVAAS